MVMLTHSRYDLELKMRMDFAQVYAAYRKDARFAHLLHVMKVVDARSGESLSHDEWQAAFLYVAFAFQKRSTAANPPAEARLEAYGHNYGEVLRLENNAV